MVESDSAPRIDAPPANGAASLVREFRDASSAAKLLWIVAAIVALADVYQYYRRGIFGVDFQPAWAAARAVLHGRTHWKSFVYLPGCLIVILPLAVLPLKDARLVLYFAEIAGIAYTFIAMTRLRHRSLGSNGVASIALLVVVAGQVGIVANYENLTLILLPFATATFLAIDQEKMLSAAILIGISLTIKPLLVPLVLIFVVLRAWRSLFLSLAIPAVLTSIVVAFSGNLANFIHEVFNTFGANNIAVVNMSLSGIGTIFGAPVALVIVLRIVVAVAGAWIAWTIMKRPEGGHGEQAIWFTAPLYVALCVCFTFSWAYYAVLLLPLLFVTLGRSDGAARLVRGGMVMALAFPLLPDATRGYPAPHPSDIIALAGFLLVLVGTGMDALSTRRRVLHPVEETVAPMPAG
jgi:arabinofuranan 3-O-arabinosyltransferase